VLGEDALTNRSARFRSMSKEICGGVAGHEEGLCPAPPP